MFTPAQKPRGLARMTCIKSLRGANRGPAGAVHRKAARDATAIGGPGQPRPLFILRRPAYLNSTLLTVTTIFSPSFFTFPVTVPSFGLVQISLWYFLPLSLSK